MAYSILDADGYCTPIRLISSMQPNAKKGDWFMFQVCDPLPQSTDWVCDACNVPSKRYEITWATGNVSYFPWYRVIMSDDTPRDIAEKLDHCARMKTAELDLDEARRNWEILNR